MKLTVLRNDPSWTFRSTERRQPIPTMLSNDENVPSQRRRAADCFREIAERNGSRAVWLPESGYLVTDDDAEGAKNFPYEEWRDQALRESGH